VGQHYAITIETDPEQPRVTRLAWEKTAVEGTMLTDHGAYCLHSNETGWSEAQLWRTCMTLSEQRRVTARFIQKDGCTLNVHKTTQPEPKLKAIYDALNLYPLPGGTKKMVA
jgi:hypothetical protein